jgi:hypothetical protein
MKPGLQLAWVQGRASSNCTSGHVAMFRDMLMCCPTDVCKVWHR